MLFAQKLRVLPMHLSAMRAWSPWTSYDKAGLEAALKEALGWEGVYYVQAWLNEGRC